ncbi:MAG TPA: hypothetical protein VNM37_05875, partial [Candidatus Dormibacteraeota bacterium]|nr:hypothetical protein [Candidatus Dormibacteraeota bacterium]
SKGAAQRAAKVAIVVDQAEGRFAHLPTLAEMRSVARAIPKFTSDHVGIKKPGVQTKLERAQAKDTARNTDRNKLRAWATKVKKRDEWKDRYDGQPVLKTAELHPRRAEAHHIEPRGNKDTRYDVRNGLCLSYEVHDRVERNDLIIVGTKFFEVNGRRYIDGTSPVKFRENKG